jgi:hypothetical protein
LALTKLTKGVKWGFCQFCQYRPAANAAEARAMKNRGTAALKGTGGTFRA